MLWKFFLNVGYETVEVEEPNNWDSVEFTLRRSDTYNGMEQEFTEGLEFVRKGAAFVRNQYQQHGIDADVNILIEGYDCGLLLFSYQGVLNFNIYKQFEGNITVGIRQSGFSETFKNRIEVPVNLDKDTAIDGQPLSAINPVQVELHGKEIHFESSFVINPALKEYSTSMWQAGNNTDPQHAIPWQIKTGEIDQTLEPSLFTPSFSYPLFYSGFTYVMGIDKRTIFVQGRIKFSAFYIEAFSVPQNFEVQFIVREMQSGQITELKRLTIFYVNSNPNGANPITYVDVSFSFTLDLPPDSHIFMRIDNQGDSNPSVYFTWDDQISYLDFQEDSIYPDSNTKAYLIHEAFAKVCESITGVQDCFRSDYFGRVDSQPHTYSVDGPGALAAITNGLNIRKMIDKEGGLFPITTSFSDLFEGLNAIHNLGMRIEKEGSKEYIRVEPKSYFYSKTNALTLSNVSDITRSIALEHIYNEAEIGYSRWETENVNGLDEFNTKRNYVLPVKNTKKKLVQVSNLIASGYAIEFTRRIQYKEKPTTDYSTDNLLFIICVEKSDGIWRSQRGGYGPHEKLFSPHTAYNLAISPSRNAQRWSNVLAASTLFKADKEAKFQSGTGNYQMVSSFLEEDSNINLEVEELFKPEYYTFTYPITFAQFLSLKNNAIYTIAFNCDGDTNISGYVKEVSYPPNGEEAGIATFKLLRA